MLKSLVNLIHGCKIVEIQEKGNKIREMRYYGLWLDPRVLRLDYEQGLADGYEVRQWLNGRLFEASI